ncbi:MAG: Maf family protein [Caldilineaceae bacterium]|nr:Maf family protein [Caldilineaceae bacterium]
MNAPKVILASNSPRRHQFFQDLGITFLAESADIDESPAPDELPDEMVARLALAKTLTVAARHTSRAAKQDPVPPHDILVIGADTVVAIEGQLLGKPADSDEARSMLVRLRARTHQVHTALALALVAGGELKCQRCLLNTTTVKMRKFGDDEIAAYLATGDPMDKAGAYAIQHPQFRPVQSLLGCPAGVMGLPVADLLSLLEEFNLNVERSPIQICPTLTGLQCCQQQAETANCVRR